MHLLWTVPSCPTPTMEDSVRKSWLCDGPREMCLFVVCIVYNATNTIMWLRKIKNELFFEISWNFVYLWAEMINSNSSLPGFTGTCICVLWANTDFSSLPAIALKKNVGVRICCTPIVGPGQLLWQVLPYWSWGYARCGTDLPDTADLPREVGTVILWLCDVVLVQTPLSTSKQWWCTCVALTNQWC